MNDLSRNTCILLGILYFANVSHTWRPFQLIFYEPNYTVSFPDALDFNLTIDENGYISFYYNFKREFRNPFIHLEYLFDDGNGNYNLVYVNKTINLCSFLANRNVDIVLRILFAVGERFGVLPKRCPLKKIYYVANMKVAADNLPPVMPEKNGRLSFMVMLKEQEKFTTFVNASVYFKLERVYKKQQNIQVN